LLPRIHRWKRDPAVVRLYGSAGVTPIDASPLKDQLLAQTDNKPEDPLRQVIEVTVTRTGTSCGYGVPVMEFIRNRRKDDHGRKYKASKDAPKVAV